MLLARKGPALVLVLLPAMLALFACLPSSTTPARNAPSTNHESPDPKVVAWMTNAAVPIVTTKPGSDAADLTFLRAMIGNARIVALGESTHGTLEFFEMKHRVLEFLVRDMGFDILAMEVNSPQALLIDDYIQTGDGDPKRMVADLGVWAWNTKEILGMIEWMRAYNRESNTGNASFYGFDMQLPRMAIDRVLGYLKQVDPSRSQYESALACYRQYQDVTFGYSTVPQSKQKECRSSLETVYDGLVRNRPNYVLASSTEGFEHALQDTRLVLQAEERYSSLANRDKRDRFMAENISWLLDHSAPETKIVVWAHNSHVSAQLPMAKSMGTWLRERYGNDLVVLGFDFYQGSFNAQALDTQKGRLGPVATQSAALPPAGSYETAFHETGIPRFVLDLRRTEQESAESEWLRGPHPFRSIGASYDTSQPGDYFYDAHLSDEYDGIIFFDQTCPSSLLPVN